MAGKKVSQAEASQGLAAAMAEHNKKYAGKGAPKMGEKVATKPARKKVSQADAYKGLTSPTSRVRGGG